MRRNFKSKTHTSEVGMRALLGFSLFALMTAGAASTCAHAETYPTRPVTFVVPFAPGGGTELLARLLGQGLERRLGKPFVIENRPGGGGVIGALSVARAAPDGYTILMAPAPVMAINAALHKKLPYDPAVDFVPVALVVATPYVLVVTPSLSVQSVADLVELARAKPGQLSFASAGLGTPHHLFAQLFKSMTGVEMTHVPYRGSVPALSDVAAGHVQLMFCDIPPALGLINEGKVRGLGVSTKERVAALPGISSIAEQGLTGFDAASWQMVVTPAATPEDIVQRLHAEIKDFMVQPEIKEYAFKMGLLPVDTPSVPSLRVFVQTEIARWGKVVEQAGIAGSQ
jgi:tripartite-type tricarboxylate transporter receptor subunit TctC